MEEKNEENVELTEVSIPILRQLKEMEVGDVKSFPINKIWNIRVYCANLKQSHGKTFQTRINRNLHIYEVERLS